jgi:hypothetical protein
MPRVYNWFSVENLPSLEVGAKIDTGGEFALDEFSSKRAYSRVKFLGDSANDYFEKYFVEHETYRHIKHRFDAEIRDILIVIDTFDIYKHKSGYYLVDTNLKNLRELAARLKSTYPDTLMLFKLRTINLLGLKEEIANNASNAEIWGGFFRDLKINRVSAASIFGHDVGDSDLWEELSAKGQLSGVWINFEFYGEFTSVMVTKHGGIVTFTSYDEKVTLELVDGINKLIEPFAEEESLSSPKRRHQ